MSRCCRSDQNLLSKTCHTYEDLSVGNLWVQKALWMRIRVFMAYNEHKTFFLSLYPTDSHQMLFWILAADSCVLSLSLALLLENIFRSRISTYTPWYCMWLCHVGFLLFSFFYFWYTLFLDDRNYTFPTAPVNLMKKDISSPYQLCNSGIS